MSDATAETTTFTDIPIESTLVPVEDYATANTVLVIIIVVSLIIIAAMGAFVFFARRKSKSKEIMKGQSKDTCIDVDLEEGSDPDREHKEDSLTDQGESMGSSAIAAALTPEDSDPTQGRRLSNPDNVAETSPVDNSNPPNLVLLQDNALPTSMQPIEIIDINQGPPAKSEAESICNPDDLVFIGAPLPALKAPVKHKTPPPKKSPLPAAIKPDGTPGGEQAKPSTGPETKDRGKGKSLSSKKPKPNKIITTPQNVRSKKADTKQSPIGPPVVLIKAVDKTKNAILKTKNGDKPKMGDKASTEKKKDKDSGKKDKSKGGKKGEGSLKFHK